MEREETTLIVFSLAFVLVLAGFLANDTAYAGGPSLPRDDLKCHEFLTSAPPQVEMLLDDQFQVNQSHTLITVLDFCNPVNKTTTNFENTTISLNQHWTVYEINTTQSSQVIATVNIVDQFHPGGFEVDVTDSTGSLMVPASKNHNGFFPGDLTDDIHYKCYELVEQDPINEIFSTQDQFGLGDHTFLTPLEICNPVEKFIESNPGSGIFDLVFGDNDISEHYLCYEISFSKSFDNVGPQIADQFINREVSIFGDDPELLCTLATKVIIGPVVGGINIPIDTSSLLLAGVQSISMWMIPVVIAGVGIGIFVIKRRK